MLQWFRKKFNWLLHVHHTVTSVECLREQKFKEIDERLASAHQAIQDIYARINGDADWFIHIERKRDSQNEEET